jgi:hypothetical protein
MNAGALNKERSMQKMLRVSAGVAVAVIGAACADVGSVP